MTHEMLRFLRALHACDGPVHVRRIGIGCSAHQAKARQDARQLGYVEFHRDEFGWSITPLGRSMLTGRCQAD
ncbi:hypothetical protein [Methylobacterium nigriterrae]|uniref:hypothetical protein n=1 Tax=Methylobacterium nigriterrae TaxID=3127512 RepID=UPI00301389AC